MNVAVAFVATLKILSLADAVTTAEEHQPQLRWARAQSESAKARADESRAPLLPQLSGVAGYQRATANFAPRPGVVPSAINIAQGSSFSTFNYFNFGLTINQLVYDFGQSWGRWRASRELAAAQVSSERNIRQQVRAQVETAFFAARAQKALVGVAQQTIANQERHLAQIEGFVRVGTRPEIDLLQAKTDRANARVQMIQADSGYQTAKALLNQAMGVENSIEYDVGDEMRPSLEGEDEGIEMQLPRALGRRPDLAGLERQIAGQKSTVRAQKSLLWGPSLGAAMALTDAGVQIDNLAWNWNFTLNLSWPLFTGLLHWSQLREQQANLEGLLAQHDSLLQQVRLEVEQARLAVLAAKATVVAAREALENARERLRLAEGRYQTGIGSAIEQGDAQLALSSAGAQQVQADYSLCAARVQLARALGVE